MVVKGVRPNRDLGPLRPFSKSFFLSTVYNSGSIHDSEVLPVSEILLVLWQFWLCKKEVQVNGFFIPDLCVKSGQNGATLGPLPIRG